MTDPTPISLLPHQAVAAVDGSRADAGSSIGVVMIHGDQVLLRGLPLPSVDNSWVAEAHAVEEAISMAELLGARQLRLLIDYHLIACIVEGRPVSPTDAVQARLAARIEDARRGGIEVTARHVQAHTQSTDLPSRLNEIAHILCGIGREDPFRLDVPRAVDWMDRLVEAESRLAFPDPLIEVRWYTFLGRNEAAHFLGVPLDTVDDLVRCCHLKVTPKGIPYHSVAQVYAVLQGMRHDAYFGFGGVRGNYEEEVARGWDARVAPKKKPRPGPVALPDPADLSMMA